MAKSGDENVRTTERSCSGVVGVKLSDVHYASCRRRSSVAQSRYAVAVSRIICQNSRN